MPHEVIIKFVGLLTTTIHVLYNWNIVYSGAKYHNPYMYNVDFKCILSFTSYKLVPVFSRYILNPHEPTLCHSLSWKCRFNASFLPLQQNLSFSVRVIFLWSCQFSMEPYFAIITFCLTFKIVYAKSIFKIENGIMWVRGGINMTKER
jgi:hypothetical protein